MAGLMLSLPTVMCCYATQAEKALLCLHGWLRDTRGKAGSGRRGERERGGWKSKSIEVEKGWRAVLRRGFSRVLWWAVDERRGKRRRGLIRGGEELEKIRENKWQVRKVNKRRWMRQYNIWMKQFAPACMKLIPGGRKHRGKQMTVS